MRTIDVISARPNWLTSIYKRSNSILEQSISNGEHKDWIIQSELIHLYSYYSNRKIIQMLYEYNTEYTEKHSATYYREDLNSTGKI